MQKRLFCIIILIFAILGCSNRSLGADREEVYIYDSSGRRVRLRLDDVRTGELLISQYDKDGNVTKVILKDEAGQDVSRQEFSSDGLLMKQETYEDGKLKGYSTFNESGQRSSDNYILDNDRYISFVYGYETDPTDDKSTAVNRRRSVTKYANGQVVYSQTADSSDDKSVVNIAANDRLQRFEYGSNVIRETMTNKSGQIIYEYIKDVANNCRYTQFENGKPVSVTEYNPNKSVCTETKMKNGKIISEKSFDFDGNLIREAEYKNGILMGYTVYTHENGKLSNRKRYSADNKLKRIYKYEYRNGVTRIVTYDGSGRLVEYED